MSGVDSLLSLRGAPRRCSGQAPRRSNLLIALCVAAALLFSGRTAAQSWEPFPDETVATLITAALYQYFDAASVFEVSVSGSSLAGDVLTVEDLLIQGKPAILHGLRGEVLTYISGLEVDLAALTNQTFKAKRVRKATVVAKSTSAAIQQALLQLSPSIMNPKISLQEGHFDVTMTIRREGKLYPTEARGTIVVVRDQQVHVALSDVKVSGGNVPMDLVGKELAKINPIADLSKWPIPLYVQRLVLHKDAVELLATSNR